MTEAMPFLQKAILLSYDPRPFDAGLFAVPGNQPLPLRLPLCGRVKTPPYRAA